MKLADGLALFGEWFADLPELDNPGLTEANNTIWTDGGYKPFHPLAELPFGTLPAAGTLPAFPRAAISPHLPDLPTSQHFYVFVRDGDDGYIYRRLVKNTATSTAWTLTSATLTGGSPPVQFAQFDKTLLFASQSDGILASTVGSSTSFTLAATAGAAPDSAAIGVVNRFVVAGNGQTTTSDRAKVQWSAINQPRNWPTPGTATAVASQAGEQYLDLEHGAVWQIFGIGHQHGVVLQEGAITRMTYVGGDIVFQFDHVDSTVGSYFPNGAIKVGSFVYFASRHGFYATDGIQVIPLSNGKCGKFFAEELNDGVWEARGVVSCGYDVKRNVIYWSYPNGDATTAYGYYVPNKLLIYHLGSGRWTEADQVMTCMVTPSSGNLPGLGTVAGLFGFNSSYVHSQFSGTAGSATFTTAEMEHNRGGYSLVQGVKPLVQGTAPAVTVAIGTRNDQDPDSLTFTSETTATASTGFCDFRSSARYHRARITVTGEFESAQGIEWQAIRQGAR